MGVTLPLHTRRDPEHLRQTTQQRQGWNSGQRHEPRTRVHVPPSCGICPSAVPHPRPSTCCQFHGIFVFIFFMTTQFDSHQSSRGRHELVFLWKYYIYYIYFLQISQSVANPAPLAPATWIRSVPVAVGSWGAGGRGKRMLLKKIK